MLRKNKGQRTVWCGAGKRFPLTPFTVAHKHEPQPTEFFVHHFSTSVTDNDVKEYSAMNRISEYRIVNIPRPIYSVTLGLPSGILRS